MKKAVLLCNHFRSFEYISDYIKNFYGENTDYYITTWDKDYNYFNSVHWDYFKGHKVDMQRDLYSYTSLDIRKVEKVIKNFGVKDYKIYTDSDFSEWVSNITALNPADLEFTELQRILGLIFQIKSCYNLIQGEYDIIIRQRLDNIPIITSDESLETILNNAFFSSKNTFYTHLMTLRRGLPAVEDRFFYGKHQVFKDIFFNIEDKLNKIWSNDLFRNRPIFHHKLIGALLLYTELYTKPSNLRDLIIRKDVVDQKVSLTNVDSIRNINTIYANSFRRGN